MKLVSMLLLLTISTSCATLKAHDPFRNPDGSINVPKVLEWIGYGLDADCLIPGAIAQDICSIGKDALATAQSVVDKDPTNAAKNAGRSLQSVLNTLPLAKQNQLTPYFDWAIKFLEGIQ